MKDIKLILVDIDGTLLNDNQIVTQKTIETLSKLKSKEILFGIATGRSPLSVIRLIEDWGIKDYVDLIMGFNGGSYLDLKTKKIKSCYLLEGRYIKEIFDDFKSFDVNAGIYDQYTIHCLKEDELSLKISNSNKFSLIIDDLSGYYDKQIEKLLFIGQSTMIDKIDEYYHSHIHSSHYRAVRSSPILYEFLNPQLSKSKGIENICNDLNITFENILTFGDELNDYEMIRDCIGVAMGNANPKIKDVAKYITKTNNEDGISYFIEKYILKV